MPRVNGKEFPYTAAGKAAAARERKKKMTKQGTPGTKKRMPREGLETMMPGRRQTPARRPSSPSGRRPVPARRPMPGARSARRPMTKRYG